MSERPPRVVAELGRPETPEETAARKAENSRLYRERKTINNLVLSLLATLGVVVIIVLAVPRGNYTTERNIDFVEVAREAQPSVTQTLATPSLPTGWLSNAAELRHSSAHNVTSWYVGWVTPEHEFVALSQGLDATPEWVADQLDKKNATGTETIGGVLWTVYDHRDSAADGGNVIYALTASDGKSDYVIFGTASPEETRILAESIAQHILSEPSEQKTEEGS
ncbi:DUF4245 domain-containing protein [Lysinibacter sp. HNR]|uniref:DUF4245 domain-containing protein n=1 Tax=Lysinibacter sp. HNR TaxID=3031408 RepID=UPI00243553D4|nr:DUF4245 domain-containing protein [Lysinibacter sp. HNR]WGD38319.1 DUF4245 domain-containing protein [Lysinibacter sp. HNR]